MRKIFKYISVALFCSCTTAQDIADSLSLRVENDMLFYQTEENKYAQSTKIFVKVILTNHSKSSYLIPLDTATFNIYDYAKEFEIELDGHLFGSPTTIFRPWIKVYDTLNNQPPKSFTSIKPDLESDEYKEESKKRAEQMKILMAERKEAYDKYGYMKTEKMIEMPEFYYFLKKHQYIIKPNQSIEFTIPVTLPENKVMLGTFRESFLLKDDENYKAVVEIDYTYNSLDKILTQKDKDSLDRLNIKMFNGKLRSNKVDMTPICN